MDPEGHPPAHRAPLRRRWRWLLGTALLFAVAVAVTLRILSSRAAPILRQRVIDTLGTRFNSRVELDTLGVSPNLSVVAHGLRIFPPDDVVAAGARAPLIAIDRFDFHASLLGLLLKPTHVESVHVQGLTLNIPPREMRQAGGGASRSRPARRGQTPVEVDRIVCDNSRLILGTNKPDKDPKLFELRHIVLDDVGPNAPWPYDATLTNAVPRGDIHATGTFGPWNTESPGDSGVTGRYLFDHVDLNTIRGIGGMLHSTGSFSGQLDRIAVNGVADVPNFSLDTANHPVPLRTRFSAVVDGTSGDTYLQPVEATLAGTGFTCRGAVRNVKGKGHLVDLDVDIPGGDIQDFLRLAVKTQPPVLSGIVTTRTRLRIRPGKESVTQKLGMQGNFTLRHIHFSNPAVQDKVDMLSLRARALPRQAKRGAADVDSVMAGRFTMGDGALRLDDLTYTLPGAAVRLNGVYTLDGRKFEFRGRVRTHARLSQMVASRWKGLLLKPVDPFFSKDGAGAEVPFRISGTEDEPHFGLDLGGKAKPTP